jgi:hypothetical protein
VQIGSDWYAMKLVTFSTKGVSAVDAESLRCGRDRAGGTEQLVAPHH